MNFALALVVCDVDSSLADWGVDDDGVPFAGEGDEREEVLPQFFDLEASKTRLKAKGGQRAHRLGWGECLVRHFNCLAHGRGALADAVAPQKDPSRLNQRGFLDFGSVKCLCVLDRLACRNF